MISLYNESNNPKVAERLLKKYTSYLDWITLLMLKNKKQTNIELHVHKLEENNKQEEKKIEIKEERKVDEKEIEKIRKELEWKYEHSISSEIPTKTSVSKLKEEKNKEIVCKSWFLW